MSKPRVRIINHVAGVKDGFYDWSNAVSLCISKIDRAVAELEETGYDLFGPEVKAKIVAVKPKLRGAIG